MRVYDLLRYNVYLSDSADISVCWNALSVLGVGCLIAEFALACSSDDTSSETTFSPQTCYMHICGEEVSCIAKGNEEGNHRLSEG